MENLKWDKQFQCGVREIDEQHQCLIHELDRLIQAIQHETNRLRVKCLLADFSEKVHDHFRFEEQYLRDRLDPAAYSDHIERHLFFEDFLRHPIFRATGDERIDTQEYAVFLVDWLSFHIRTLDKQAFCSKRASIEPER